MRELSHVDDEGNLKMVDVGSKATQRRVARASGFIKLAPGTVALISERGLPKGDVVKVAQIAGIQGAKQTAQLIPLCHPLSLDCVTVELDVMPNGVRARSEVRCVGRTGVEMEALTAVGVALLTVYDMCKAVDKEMEIGEIRLEEKIKQNVE